jgi:hypothetical protein
MAVVSHNGYFLRHVPESQRTVELCAAAVRDFHYAIRYVPESLKKAVEKAAGLNAKDN